MSGFNLSEYHRLVIKVGSSLLIGDDDAVHRGWLEGLAENIATLQDQGHEILIVSSGAIAIGSRVLGINRRRARLEDLQAAAAAGQVQLVHAWQEALAPMVQGKAAMYVMGNFAVAPLKKAGLTDETLGYFQFPEITPGLPKAEEAPTDTFHIPSKAKNKEDARKFLAFLAQADVQTKWNETLGQLPVNSKSQVADDQFLKAGFEVLNNAKGIAHLLGI